MLQNLYRRCSSADISVDILSDTMQLIRGKLKLLILDLLGSEPMHGYALMSKIEEITGHRPSPGSIYPLLKSLVRAGLVEVQVRAEGGRVVRIYRLTDKGLSELRMRGKEVEKAKRLARTLALLRQAGFRDLVKHLLEVSEIDEEALRTRLLPLLRECAERVRLAVNEVTSS